MNTHDIELPPLPEPGEAMSKWAYDEPDMQAYARAAIEADRKRRGAPVPKGWKLVPETPTSKQIVHMALQIKGADADGTFRTDGDDWPEHVDAAERAYKWALSEAPQPAELRLDAPAQVGHTRFGCGEPWSTVIGAAQRYHAIENTPTKEQERLKKAAERIKALQPAEPAKEVELRPQDLFISTYSPTPSPQWAAHNDRGVRIVHLPTGTVAESHEELSPHRNREIALDRLRQAIAAEPVKVPSDDEIEALVRKTASDVFGIGDAAYGQDDREFYGRFARSLLARYGNNKGESNG